MVFGVIGFGLTSVAFLITFAKYFTKDWFPYFMFGLVLFEICLLTLTRGKRVEPERPPTRTEKSVSANRPPPPPDSPKPGSPKAPSNLSPKSQATSNKQEKAAEKTAKKAQAKEAKAEAKAATTAK